MIEKINFRDQVKDLLLQKMKQGLLVPKQVITLASLARELEVSVTPIREALTQLQNSGIVIAVPNRGFLIPELKEKEAKDLYELVVTLETLAIKNSVFDDKTLKKLEKQNNIFLNSKNKIERINADMEFHNLLVSKFNNEVAKRILSELKTRIFFYEVDFMDRENFYSFSNDEHQQIIDALKNQDVEKATKTLKNNWLKFMK